VKSRILSISYSKEKGGPRIILKEAALVKGSGLKILREVYSLRINPAFGGIDARGQAGSKEVSLLSIESIEKLKECPKAKREAPPFGPGDLSENITTAGIDLSKLKIGDKLRLGEDTILEITKTGRKCHKYCLVHHETDECAVPREGLFAKVRRGGKIAPDDKIEIVKKPQRRI
jgi:hypothetical protein